MGALALPSLLAARGDDRRSAYYHRVRTTLDWSGSAPMTSASGNSGRRGRLSCPGPPAVRSDVASGAGSVAYWYWSELAARRSAAYALAVGPCRRPRCCAYDARSLFPVTSRRCRSYGPRRCSRLRSSFFDVGHLVSGHTLKHVAAALGVGSVVVMLRTRVPTRARSDLST